MNDLGLPEDIFTFVNYPTRFDSREAKRLLGPAGIRVPPIEDYAWRLWDYWERHLDPDLFIDQPLGELPQPPASSRTTGTAFSDSS